MNIDLFADKPVVSNVPPVLELKDICQAYDKGRVTVFDRLNLKIEDPQNRGRMISILGPSGSGKSTILRYIAGLQEPSAGSIMFHGKPRVETDRVGMVFQRYSSLPWLSVIDNIQLGLKFQGEKDTLIRATEMLTLVELNGHERKFAQAPTLSGGQLQRVAIARSLLANPKILLMDEPFGALDVKTRLKMQDSLLHIAKILGVAARANGTPASTIISVTHDISEALYLSDEIWVLGGTPSTLVRTIKVPFITKSPELKKTNEFQKMVSELEDYMMRPG